MVFGFYIEHDPLCSPILYANFTVVINISFAFTLPIANGTTRKINLSTLRPHLFISYRSALYVNFQIFSFRFPAAKRLHTQCTPSQHIHPLKSKIKKTFQLYNGEHNDIAVLNSPTVPTSNGAKNKGRTLYFIHPSYRVHSTVQ